MNRKQAAKVKPKFSRLAKRPKKPNATPKPGALLESLLVGAFPLILNALLPNQAPFPAMLAVPGVPRLPRGLLTPFPEADGPSHAQLCRTVDELKDIEPVQVSQKKMPDYTTVLTGWRAWRTAVHRNQWRLAALGQGIVWPPKRKLAARCKDESASPHPAPCWECSCGVWAFKDLDRLLLAVESYDVSVLGKVSLWGRIIETENGYRAEYAYPSELWLVNSRLEDLGRIYGVPVRVKAVAA
jgi:hypothetical protein